MHIDLPGAVEPPELTALLGPPMTPDEIRQERITRRVWDVGIEAAEREIRSAYIEDRIDEVELEAAIGCLPYDID